MYDYHIKGLDIMVNETKAGKEAVAKSYNDARSNE